MLFTQENQNSTVIAHNGAGYDNKFILQYCLFKGLTPSSFIRQGSKITYMYFEKKIKSDLLTRIYSYLNH